jgi:SAM-dependent methyltransferase
VVLELGCGSGALTRHLVDAGHRVVATDASTAMLELARRNVPGADEHRLLTLPHDPLPACDAVVSVGHVLSYLPDEDAIKTVLAAAATALHPGGVFAIDLLDLGYGDDLDGAETRSRVGEDWAVAVKLFRPEERLYVREITAFTRNEDGSWRRDDERHENVLVDTARVSSLPGPKRDRRTRREILRRGGAARGPRGHRGQPDRVRISGGGGNRTRVRGRTGESLYKLVLPLSFARRPVAGDLPTG